MSTNLRQWRTDRLTSPMMKVGNEGAGNGRGSQGMLTELDVVEGMQSDRGYVTLFRYQRREDEYRAGSAPS